MPYEDDPHDESLEAHWQVRQHARSEAERLELEVWEADQRTEPRHMTVRVGANNQRVRRRGQVGTLSVRQWRRIVKAFRSCCAYCGLPVQLPALEHVLPVAQGGETTIWNVVPACRSCNTAKRGRDPLEWLGRDRQAVEDFTQRVLEAGKTFNDGGLPKAP